MRAIMRDEQDRLALIDAVLLTIRELATLRDKAKELRISSMEYQDRIDRYQRILNKLTTKDNEL